MTRCINLRSENIEFVPTQRSSNHGEYTAAFGNANRHISEPSRKILFRMDDNGCPESRLRQDEMPSDLVWRSSNEIPGWHGIKKVVDILHAVLGIERFQNGWTQALTKFLGGGGCQRPLAEQVIERSPIQVRQQRTLPRIPDIRSNRRCISKREEI